MIGQRLGPYEITAKLGEGGMGEVYRAHDTKLKRDVAIKVLPAAFTEDKERLARFEREAQLLAQLHHSNIASIFGLEESDGTRALVMELVEGPTLAERLEAGPLSFNECLSVSVQIAHALEEAHEKGIVHRDLKPQNIKASIEGKTKVLDFGLAKAMDSATGFGASSDLAHSPTVTFGGTREGVILGTAAYMAPEQARAGVVDKRADIWAFGVVLYEMLTGERLFAEGSLVDTLSAVMRKEIDLDRLPAATPPRLRELIARCLERDPKRRLRDIGDALWLLTEGLAALPAPELAAAPTPPSIPVPAATWGGLSAGRWAALALSSVALGALLLLDRPAPPRVVRSSLLPPPETTFHLESASPGPIALSPDGRQIAFTARDAAGRRSLWVRNLAALEARELPGTDQAQYPFWSPDSQQVGFFNGAQLKKIAIAGGAPVTLAKAQTAKGGSWSPRGLIVFAPSQTSGLSVVPAAGGEAKPLTELAKEPAEISHRHPRFLPDGEQFLFVVRRTEGAELRVGALDGSPPVKLAATDSNAEYAAGRLLFVRESTLLAQPFDPRSRTLSGEAVPVAENLFRIRSAHLAVFTTASDGTLAYQTGAAPVDSRLVWRDRAGKELGLLGEPASHRSLRLSPDGASVAVEIDDPESGEPDLWLYDVRRALRSRFTFDATADRWPVWSPDSQSLAFASRRGGPFSDIWSAPIGGTEPPRRLTTGERQIVPTSWSPDGQRVVATAWGARPPDVVVVPAAGGEPAPLAATEFVEGQGEVSSDGRWLAFRSNETGRDEIYVTSFPTPGRKWQLSQGEGHNPVWRGDGRELFYRDQRGLHVAEVDGTRPVFEVGAVRRLFDLPPITGSERNFDAAPDGQRFLIVEPLEAQELAPVTLVLNWDAELPKP